MLVSFPEGRQDHRPAVGGSGVKPVLPAHCSPCPLRGLCTGIDCGLFLPGGLEDAFTAGNGGPELCFLFPEAGKRLLFLLHLFCPVPGEDPSAGDKWVRGRPAEGTGVSFAEVATFLLVVFDESDVAGVLFHLPKKPLLVVPAFQTDNEGGCIVVFLAFRVPDADGKLCASVAVLLRMIEPFKEHRQPGFGLPGGGLFAADCCWVPECWYVCKGAMQRFHMIFGIIRALYVSAGAAAMPWPMRNASLSPPMPAGTPEART